MPAARATAAAAIENDSFFESKMATPPDGMIVGDDVLRFEKCIAERLQCRKPYSRRGLRKPARRFEYACILAALKSS